MATRKRRGEATPVAAPARELTPEEVEEWAKRGVEELLKMSPEERGAFERSALAISARTNDNPRGFADFFELMHGTPLHAEGKKWIAAAYKAHSLGKGFLAECHRESGKTTVFSKFFLAFRIGHEPHKKSCVIRINDEKANETAAAVAHLIEHDKTWKMVFPHVVPDPERGWGAKGYNVKRTDVPTEEWAQVLTQGPIGPSFVGHGWSSGSIIGSRYDGTLIVDDIHDGENTASDRQLAAVKKFYSETLEFCLMTGAWEIWNFTPWLTNDLYAYLKSTKAYFHVKSPVMKEAEVGEEGAEEWPSAPSVPLSGRPWKRYHPEKWTWDVLTSKYIKNGAIDFARMMLLDLEATKGFHLKAEWLHEYPGAQIYPSWPVLFGIDYASTADKLRDKDRDYFAMAIVRAIPGGGLVLVDGLRAHMSKGEALEAVASYWGVYPTLKMIGVEAIGKGEEFYNDLVMLQNAYGRTPPLFPIKSHGKKNKGERFEKILAPKFQFSRIWISDTPTPFLNEFRNEWLLWPNSEHDDCLDGVYMAYVAGQGYVPVQTEFVDGAPKKRNPFLAIGKA